LLDDLRNQILQRDAVPLENGDEHFVYATDIPHRDTEFRKNCTGYSTAKIFPMKPKISYCMKTHAESISIEPVGRKV